MTPDGEVSLFVEYDGEPNGLKIHKDGRIFIADNRNGIMFVDPETKRVERFASRVANEHLRGPNDLSFALNWRPLFHRSGQQRPPAPERPRGPREAPTARRKSC